MAAFHKRHTHGRVFHGEEARELLRIHKRDSHGDTPVMHVPAGFDGTEPSQSQAVSVVYVTMPQTFSGPAQYLTLTGNPNATPTPAAAAHATHQTDDAKPSEVTKSSSAIAAVTPSTSEAAATPMTTLATASVSAIGALNQVASSTDSSATVLAGTPLQATRTSTPQAENQTSSGMSGGARAGLAFGIILAIALTAGLVYFCMRRKKNAYAKGEEAINEKHGSFADTSARQVEAGAKRGSILTQNVPASHRSSQTTSTAPRLSLRRLTQFLPNLNEERSNTENNSGVGAAGFTEKPRSAWERQQPNSRQNPFDDEKQARSNSPPANPFDEPEGKTSSEFQNNMVAAASGNTGHNTKSSGESAEHSTSKSPKFGATGPVKDFSPPRGPNNVHRVQLDFKPSMDDELELRSGQLVRMLHEYDDGWALCIRMDRSQQGVTPRTCLSKLPVKPRPQGPPSGPRPGTSQGPRRPSNPPMPLNGQMAGPMQPRPLTPTQAHGSRSPPETRGETAFSPVGSVPQRKPVPGQAM